MSVKRDLPGWIRLKDPPLSEKTIASVNYYDDNGKNTVFIFVSDAEVAMQYDLDQRIILDNYSFDNSFDVGTCAAIDRVSDKIYFSQHYQEQSIGIYDIESGERIQAIDETVSVEALCFFPEPFNELYAAVDCYRPNLSYFLKYNASTKKKVRIKSNHHAFEGDSNAFSLISRQNPRQLLMFKQSNRKSFIFCDLSANDEQKSLVWKKYKLEMPCIGNEERRLRAVLVFDCLLFVFTEEFFGGYVVDLSLDDKAKWIKFEMDLTKYAPFKKDNDWIENVILDKQHNIHLLNLWERRNFVSPFHAKISAFDLIPSQIIKAKRRVWEPLVVGFVKEVVKRHSHLNVPIYLKMLILNFYPIYA